jgi:hypothetical protein
MAILGPNTAAHTDFLAPAAIVCAGEDPSELQRTFDAGDADVFEYRCYRFWRFVQTTVIWTGMGTGCLEPLLWEILSPGVIKKLLLVGSAGRLPNSRAPIGEARIITEAYAGGTSLDAESADQPIRPRFALPAKCPPTSIVSTDFYYGFTGRTLTGKYPAAGAALRASVEKHLSTRDLVDMETAQFYHFCDRFDRTGRLQYLAIKGAANPIDWQMAQLGESAPLLSKCFRRAWEMVGEEQPTRRL